jgi:Na+/H+ antiporter NhaD/arsenite permease-like protein
MVDNSLVLTDAMIVSAAILVVTFLGIFSEHVHGMERAKFATAGAAAMIIAGQIYGFYSPELAIAAVDWNVIFLLGCMMMIISIMIPTGGFEVLAYRIARLSRARLCLLLMLLGCVVAIVSLLLDNVTTVVIFGPLIILIARAQKISPVPYLMAAALLTDVGGTATLIGDPPNLMIGSATGIDFNTFIGRMWLPVLGATVSILIFLKWTFRKQLKTTPPEIFHEKAHVTNKKVWIASLIILACMVVLFTIHTRLDGNHGL